MAQVPRVSTRALLWLHFLFSLHKHLGILKAKEVQAANLCLQLPSLTFHLILTHFQFQSLSCSLDLCPLNILSLTYSETNQEGEGGGESSKESAPYLGQALCWLTSRWWEGE